MLDTMTLTKIGGAFFGALLILLLGNWAAEELYNTDAHGGHGAHGEDHAKGYKIETGADDSAGEAEEEIDFGALLAAADAGKGERVFGKCKACHKLEDGANGTGPHLFGLVDRTVGSVDGFGYSGALVAVADVWNADNLQQFLESPKKFAPGTKMAFSGLKKPQDRANLIAYLATISN